MIGKPQAGLPSGMAGMGDDFPTLPRRDVILTLAGVMLALFLSALDQTIVATALPSIVLDLGGFDRLTWITTSYLVASTTAVPIAGRLSDMYGRKWFFVIGIVIFLVGSVLAGLSQSMNQLIVFRAIQGIGGGVMMANAFTTIADIFPPAERGKYMGFMTGVFGVAAILGPLLGGLITDGISWHWIFYVNVPIAIPVLFLFIKYFPDAHVQRTEHNIDYLGVLLLISGVVPLLIGLAWADVEYAWGSVQVIGALAFGTVMLIALVWWETKAEEPIIQLQMFKSRLIAVSLFIIFLTGFAMFGAIIFIPLYFQAVLGASASASGTFLTPMMLGMVFGATISGQALSRLGGHYRRQGMLGLAVMIAGAVLLTQISETTGRLAATGMIVLFGFGMGTTFPLYTIAIQNTVPRHMMGIATSSTQFFRSIGGTIGLAIFGSFYGQSLHRWSR
jgi:EmrB/QacA subfamily drug resistance transporter